MTTNQKDVADRGERAADCEEVKELRKLCMDVPTDCHRRLHRDRVLLFREDLLDLGVIYDRKRELYTFAKRNELVLGNKFFALLEAFQPVV